MKTRYLLSFLFFLFNLCSAANPSWKPRVINTTDLGADPDDEQSMVRQLVSANEFDLEGLIVVTGCWKKEQSDTRMLDRIVDAYGEVERNLRVHADGYPSVAYLRSISVMGQTGYGMEDVGDGKDSAGSELIITAIDKDDPRPVWVMCWGGANTLAQAIWKVKSTRSADELASFLGKLRVFDILGQDDAGAWIANTFPEVFYIRATGVYGWQPSNEYLVENIQSKGPLGAVYPDTKWATEGDTPAFLHVFPNGLNDPEQMDQGGWGGRFSFEKQEAIRSMEPVKNETEFDPYFMYGNTPEMAGAIKRWHEGYDNDFAARMQWSITPRYAEANHHPVAVVNGDASRNVIYLEAAAGTQVSLNARGSEDPDGNSLQYHWEVYEEPSTYKDFIQVEGITSEVATVFIPIDAVGKCIHMILKLQDDGTPHLTVYRRVVIRIIEPV